MNKILSVLIILTLFLFSSCSGGGGGGSGSVEGSGGDSSTTTQSTLNSSPSALCNDGTYSYSQNCSGTCSWHGGVAVWYNNCGQSSEVPLFSRENDNFSYDKSSFVGIWEGKWSSDKYDRPGLFQLKISEDGLFEGNFLNDDDTLNSKIHGSEPGGNTMIFIDYHYGPDTANIEYPGNGFFKVIDNLLLGDIVVQEVGGADIREFELYKK